MATERANVPPSSNGMVEKKEHTFAALAHIPFFPHYS